MSIIYCRLGNLSIEFSIRIINQHLSFQSEYATIYVNNNQYQFSYTECPRLQKIFETQMNIESILSENLQDILSIKF